MATKKPVTFGAQTCTVCGRDLEQSPGRGRPRQYHHECGELQHRLTQVQEWLGHIRFRDDEYAKRMAREFFALRNQLQPGRYQQSEESKSFVPRRKRGQKK